MSKSQAIAKQETGGALVDQAAIDARQAEIEAQIRKQLQTINERTSAPSQNTISLKGKRFTLPSGELAVPQGQPFSCVVLDDIWWLTYYKAAFNQNKKQDPACFAIGRHKPESGLLVPHETAPEKQGDNCDTCPKNQWGSSPTGNGKACKNQRRLIIVPPDATDSSAAYTVYVSPTAIKKYDAYVRELAMIHKIDPVQAITDLNFDEAQTYPSLTFKFHSRHNNLVTMWGLREKHQPMVEHVPELKGDDRE